MNRSVASHAEREEKRLYPIRTVAQLTNVNPITLRAWERRYKLLRPIRTPAGHRLYSDEDIRRIREILDLSEQGIGLAQIAAILANRTTSALSRSITAPSRPASRPRTEIAVQRQTNRPDGWHRDLEQAVIDMDGIALTRIERNALAWLQPDGLVETLLLPALERLEARQAWPDQDLALKWFGEHLLARLHWLMDSQATTTLQQRPLLAVEAVDACRPYSSQEYRLLLQLAQSVQIRILPRALDTTQAKRLVTLWEPRGWLRLVQSAEEPWASTPPAFSGKTSILPCLVEAATSSPESDRSNTSIALLRGTPDHCYALIKEQLGL